MAGASLLDPQPKQGLLGPYMQMELYDVAMSSLTVTEADCLAQLAEIIGRDKEAGTVHSSKERRRPLFWQPFSAVTEPAPGLLVPLSGILASRRRKPQKNEKKRGKNGRDMA